MKMPDLTVVVGNEMIGGDSFANLPQNGNDAASFILRRAMERRNISYRVVVDTRLARAQIAQMARRIAALASAPHVTITE